MIYLSRLVLALELLELLLSSQSILGPSSVQLRQQPRLLELPLSTGFVRLNLVWLFAWPDLHFSQELFLKLFLLLRLQLNSADSSLRLLLMFTSLMFIWPIFLNLALADLRKLVQVEQTQT